MSKRTARLAILAGIGLAAAASGCSKKPPARTGKRSERPTLAEYNLPENLVGIRGYSPVSYFEKGQAEKGTTPFVVSHRGIHYKFTSPTQMNTFKADPDKYEPAYGGWCAFGMSSGRKDPVDPTSFKIVDGRLLLFMKNGETDARELWEQRDDRELMESADRYWNDLTGE